MKKADWEQRGTEINIIEGLEIIRCRPSAYLGDLERGDLFDDLIFEALCHSIDEAIEGNCTKIQITIETAGSILVQYNAGMSLAIDQGKPLAETLLTVLHACHNLKKNIEIGSRYCQFGLAVLNAVCSEFQVDTVCNNQQGSQFYRQGKPEQDFIIVASNIIDQTRFRFILDKELLGHHEINLDNLRSKALELMQNTILDVLITSQA
jgi:DNA gyrase/topoisomerase IV subunit B